MTLHRWTVAFLMNSLVTAALGFTNLVERAAEIGKILFIISVVVCAALLLAELVVYLRRLAESLDRD
jgi:uncharacterized membrane protein YtjA (UPF0391 family)